MKITVPFSYLLTYVPPRCRKPRRAKISDSVEVDIPSIPEPDAPLAFSWNERVWNDDGVKVELPCQRRWFDNQLWMPIFQGSEERLDRVSVTFGLLKDIVGAGRSYANPFFIDDHSIGFSEYAKRKPSLKQFMEDESFPQSVIDKASSTKQQVIDIVNAVRVIEVGGLLWVSGSEPRYMVNTFGFGRNHGGTGAFVETSYNPNIGEENYFNANEYEEFLAFAESIAKDRGDTQSIPCLPDSEIVVYLKEAVKYRSNLEWYVESTTNLILAKSPSAEPNPEFLETAYQDGLTPYQAVSSWYKFEAERTGGLCIRKSETRLDDSSDTWEIISFNSEGDEVVEAVTKSHYFAKQLVESSQTDLVRKMQSVQG